MFAVASFMILNEVDVVPVTWLSETEEGCVCFWP